MLPYSRQVGEVGENRTYLRDVKDTIYRDIMTQNMGVTDGERGVKEHRGEGKNRTKPDGS